MIAEWFYRLTIYKEKETMGKKINSKLFKDNLFEVCDIHKGEYIGTVLAENESDACSQFGGNENLSACSIWENEIGVPELIESLNESQCELNDILKSPNELLLECFNDANDEEHEYKVQMTYTYHHASEYILIGKYGVILTFMITNADYNVFNVSASGNNNFFASRNDTKIWLDFLNKCEEIKRTIYEIKNYEYENNED